MALKPGVRTIGFDDAPRQPGDVKVAVVGVVMRGDYVEAVLRTDVLVDGDDATGRITEAIAAYPGRNNLVGIFTQNLMVAGFNIIDLPALADATGLPAVAAMKGQPDRDAIRSALTHSVTNGEAKVVRYTAAGPGFTIHKGHAWCAGTSEGEARELLRHAHVRGILPEPVRLAHLVGAGWTLGASKGS